MIAELESSGSVSRSLVLWMVVIGHAGLHIAIYNRVNSFGLPRKWIKRLVKYFFVQTLAIPTLVLAVQGDVLLDVVSGTADWQSLGSVTLGYGWLCLGAWVVFGVPWLLWRPVLRLEWADAPRTRRVVDVAAAVEHPLPLTTKAKWESRIPWNQILQLSIEHVRLPVVGLPRELDGYRIAHLSDIHLTGEIHADYTKFAVAQANAARPDLIALTGDIIDKQPCIDWLVDIFSPAEAADGCFFILGNHDTRVVDSWETREAMDRAGWIDLGSEVTRRNLRGVDCHVIGNEFPWFERCEIPTDEDVRFRMLLSHSPDQLSWARKRGIELMLAGHTHGGQGRLPLAGPILSPSLHGSRYASGDFYRAPTTMHVSRGLSGVHLLRLNCRPELSIITLKCADQ